MTYKRLFITHGSWVHMFTIWPFFVSLNETFSACFWTRAHKVNSHRHEENMHTKQTWITPAG